MLNNHGLSIVVDYHRLNNLLALEKNVYVMKRMTFEWSINGNFNINGKWKMECAFPNQLSSATKLKCRYIYKWKSQQCYHNSIRYISHIHTQISNESNRINTSFFLLFYSIHNHFIYGKTESWLLRKWIECHFSFGGFSTEPVHRI